MHKEELRQRLLKEGFGCYAFYIPISSEIAICEKLNTRYPDAYFLTLRRMMHRSKDGRKWNEEDILLKNYIFVYLRTDECIDFLKEIGSLLFLNDNGNNGKLTDQNYKFAEWILKINGLLDVSTATLQDGLVKITGGPLLQMQNSIRKYSRRNRNCFVCLNVAGIKVETWLPFEWEN